MPTPHLTLLTAPDCHLCRHAVEVLGGLDAEIGLDWVEVGEDTPRGERLAQGAPPLRPLLVAGDGRLLAAGRLSAKRLRRDLGGGAAGGALRG